MKGPNRPKWGKAAGTFALGAAAGSTLAFLFAPASGKATRKRIGMQIQSLGRTTEQKLLRAKKLLARKAVTLRASATERLEDTRDWVTQQMGNHRQPVPRRVPAHRS